MKEDVVEVGDLVKLTGCDWGEFDLQDRIVLCTLEEDGEVGFWDPEVPEDKLFVLAICEVDDYSATIISKGKRSER